MKTGYKKGATLKAEVNFTDEEWAAIYPWTAVYCQATQKVNGARFDIEVHPLPEHKSVVLVGDTSDWFLKPAIMDILFVKGGEKFYFPPKSDIEIAITRGVSEVRP